MQDAPDNMETPPRAPTRRAPRRGRAPGEVSRSAGKGRSRAWGCAICLLVPAWPAFAGSPATLSTPETIIRLHATAVVTGEEILLSDVAEVEGEASELAAGWPMAAAPRPGSSGSIDINHIQSVLARRGANLSRWVFRGSSRCVVNRPAGTLVRSKTGMAGRLESATRKPVTPTILTTRPAATPVALRDAAAPDPATLEGVIHAHLRDWLGEVEGALSVRFSPSTARLLGLSTSHYQFRVTNRGEKTLGMVPLEVTILEKDQVRQVVQVVCQATLAKQVVVAVRSMNRGETIQAADLSSETRTFEKLEDIGLASAAPLIGQRTRRLIKSGDQLGMSDIEPVPLVERNDLVTVSIRRGALGITATARALSSGSYGEQVSLRSELSKENFVGLVVGPKTVVLSDAAGIAGGAKDASRSVAVAVAGGNR